MSTQQASSGGVRIAEQVLDLTIAQAREADREDLVERLSDARRLLVDASLTVHVVGESQQGKSSLMALIAPSGGIRHPGRLTLIEAGTTVTGHAGTLPAPALERQIGRSHAVLFVSDASSELTRAEIEYLRAIQDLCPTIVLVLTKIDVNAQWREVLERDKSVLNTAGICVSALAVSAVLRTQSLRCADDELARISGVPKLIDALEAITADAERTSLRAVANHTLFALDQLTEMLRFRQSRLTEPNRPAQARTAARRADERAAALRRRVAAFQKLLVDSFATISSDVDFDLRQRMQAVLTDAEHTIEQGDPATDWDTFATWLHQRLAYEARANRDLVVTSSRIISQRAAEHFMLSEMHIIDPPLVGVPTDTSTTLTADRALGDRGVGLSAGLNVFFRAYMGFMMFVLLRGMTGLDIPFAIGLVPALLLGGLALMEDRKRQLDKRRVQASATVRNIITDFNMRITKDARDLVRQLDQELRDAYSTRIEQIQHKIAETRNLAEATLGEQEQCPTLLQQIDADLALLTDLRGRTAAIIPAQLLAPSNVVR